MLERTPILLVEDNEGDVELTRRALSASLPQCRLDVANDGAAGLDFLYKRGEFAEASTPKLILLDLNMPRLDGKSFLERVKRDQALRSIPVVILTSSQSPQDICECYQRHANCYVVKPFDGREYAEAVTEVVSFWMDRALLP